MISDHAEDDVVPVPIVEEFATVAKNVVATGRITVQTTTEIRHEAVRENLIAETVEVTRVPIDRVVDTLPQVRVEGDLTIIPVLEERIVITKQLVLVEEVQIRRARSIDQVDVPVTLRRQVARVTEEDL